MREVENNLCKCGHERKFHAKIPWSPNYTQGKCSKCKCKYFVIEDKKGGE